MARLTQLGGGGAGQCQHHAAHQPSLMMLHAHLAGSGLARTDSLKTSETDVATLVEVFKIEGGGQRLRF